MRVVVGVVLLLAGCRQALGIPGGGDIAGEDNGFHVEVVVRGGDGASNGAAVMLNGQIEQLTDGPLTLATALPDGVEFAVTPIQANGDCRVMNGTGVIDGANVAGVAITCDGLAALADPGFSAPADFGTAFDPTRAESSVFGSVLTQQTYLSPAAMNDGVTLVEVGGQVTPGESGYGPFAFASDLTVATANEGFPRMYTLRPVREKPAVFGYGKPGEVEAGGAFGAAVAGDAGVLVVGAPELGSGRAYVFRRAGREWVQEQELTHPAVVAGDRFGAAVAVRGDRIVVGAPGDASRAGAAYEFTLTMTGWVATPAPLRATPTAAGDRFGAAVAIGATHVIVGAPGCEASGCVFELGATTTKLCVGKSGDDFGASLAISGTTLVVGAPGDDSFSSDPDDVGSPDAGAAYVVQVGATAIDRYLKSDRPGADDRFGAAVAVDGEHIVVGAPGEDSDARGVTAGSVVNDFASASGAAYVFRAGAQLHYVKSPFSSTGDNFGHAVALRCNTVNGKPRTCVVAIGAPYENSGRFDLMDGEAGAPDAGAVFVYELTPADTLGAPEYLKAKNIGAGDAFGLSLVLDLDTLVVGAPAEDSSRTGWNTNANEGALDAGAVYSFR